MSQRKFYLISALCYSLFEFWATLVVQHSVIISHFDQFGFTTIHTLYPRWNPFFMTITQLGNPSIAAALSSILGFILLLNRQVRPALFWISTIISGNMLNYLIKTIIQRPRPTLMHLVQARGYSFPSGHSDNSVLFFGALAVMVISLWPIGKRHRLSVAILALFFILGIGSSRVYLQVHFPSDIIGGFLLGGGTLSLNWALARRFYWTPTRSVNIRNKS